MLFTFHVNDVPGLVVSEVGGQVLHSLLLVAPGEHVSGATTVSSGVAHLEVCLLSESVRDALILEVTFTGTFWTKIDHILFRNSITLFLTN